MMIEREPMAWANPKDKPVILKPTKEQKENFMKAFEENK